MNKPLVFEIEKTDKDEGIVEFWNFRGHFIHAIFWGVDIEVGKDYMVEFYALDYSLRWETVFSENKNKECKIEQAEWWTKKNNVSFYGYKNHVKADTKTKLIKDYAVTDASVHDSQVLGDLLDETDRGKSFMQTVPTQAKRPRKSIRQKKWWTA